MQSTASASITFDRAEALKRVVAERRRSMLIDLSITLLTILLALALGFIGKGQTGELWIAQQGLKLQGNLMQPRDAFLL